MARCTVATTADRVLGRAASRKLSGNGKIRFEVPPSVNPLHLPVKIKARFKAMADGAVFTHGDEK